MALARQLLAALAVAHGATALLDGFVDVVVRTDVHVYSDAFAGMVGAAIGAGDDGYQACSIANDLINTCESPDSDAGPDPDQCLCCSGTAAVASVYSSCASYLTNNVPKSSTAYQLASQLYRICSKRGTDACTATQSDDSTPSATQGSPGAITGTGAPPACTSMLRIYSSCYEELSTETVPPAAVASCFCYDQSGNYNTAFDDYAQTCASFAKTADPEDYSVIITRLATLCDELSALTSSEALVFSTVRSGSSSGGFGLPSSTSSGSLSSASSASSSTQSTGQAAASTSAASTSSSSALAAPGVAVPGFSAWAANLATFVLSFFFLI